LATAALSIQFLQAVDFLCDGLFSQGDLVLFIKKNGLSDTLGNPNSILLVHGHRCILFVARDACLGPILPSSDCSTHVVTVAHPSNGSSTGFDQAHCPCVEVPPPPLFFQNIVTDAFCQVQGTHPSLAP